MKKLNKVSVVLFTLFLIINVPLFLITAYWSLSVFLVISEIFALLYSNKIILPSKKLILFFQKLKNKSVVFGILPTIIWAISLLIFGSNIVSLPFTVVNLFVVILLTIIIFICLFYFVITSLTALVTDD